jgi:hypothetical protein
MIQKSFAVLTLSLLATACGSHSADGGADTPTPLPENASFNRPSGSLTTTNWCYSGFEGSRPYQYRLNMQNNQRAEYVYYRIGRNGERQRVLRQGVGHWEVQGRQLILSFRNEQPIVVQYEVDTNPQIGRSQLTLFDSSSQQPAIYQACP